MASAGSSAAPTPNAAPPARPPRPAPPDPAEATLIETAAAPIAPRPRRFTRRLPAWCRAVLLALGVSGVTGLATLMGESLGFGDRAAVIWALPGGAIVGVLLAILLILIPERRAAADRRWLIQCLNDVARVDRAQRFSELLSRGDDHELSDLAHAVHAALLTAHKDRLEAAHLRRELESRVQRQTRAAVAHLSRLVQTDELTGLGSRRGFDAGFIELFDEAAASGEELTLVAIDLDHFKELNDTCGHEKGDVALKAAGEVLRAQLREGDLAGRIGGDELMIVLRATGSTPALKVAQRIANLYAQHPAALGLPCPWPTMSIGIACAAEHHCDSPDHLRRLADEALYAVKRNGRAGVKVWEPGFSAHANPPSAPISAASNPGRAA